MSLVRVAAAAIADGQGNYLLAKRPPHKHQGDLWEFPGGKIESGETAEHALIRELHEELNIHATDFHQLIRVIHDYADKSVELIVYKVNQFRGELKAMEDQPLAWVKPVDMRQYAMPKADEPIVNALRLPSCLLITPELHHIKHLEAGLRSALAQGVRLVQLRAHGIDDAQYAEWAFCAYELCSMFGAELLLNRAMNVATKLKCHGVHLSARELQTVGVQNGFVKELQGRWLSASCHNHHELLMAQTLGCHFVLLGPVLATRSHAGMTGMGWTQFQALTEAVNMPVYALGGMSADMLHTSYQQGGQGIAAISALWPIDAGKATTQD